MKMSRKWILVAALVLSVAMASSGTIAYLQDSDSDVNVMTMGSVYIEQIEQERDASGNLVSFTQGKPALPAVYNTASKGFEWAAKGDGVDVNGTEYIVFHEDVANVIDKIVTVKNTGKSDAFVRTIVALEAPGYDAENYIHVNSNTDDVLQYTAWAPVIIDGIEYIYRVFTYNKALTPNEISAPSLMQLFLDPLADNDYCEKFGDTWEVLVVSQAVQADGFADAETALDAAFGEVSAASHPWMDMDGKTDEEGDQEPDDVVIPTVVTNSDELYKAFENNADIILAGNIELDEDYVPYGDKENGIYFTGTLDGQGFTVSGLKVEDGDYVGFINAVKDATIKNLIVEGEVSGDNAAGVASRVEGNCVFENVVSNVTVNGSVKAGGIAANVCKGSATFINCVNNAAIYTDGTGGANGLAGGMIGYVNNDGSVVIENCTNNGNIESAYTYAAGAAVGYGAGPSEGEIVNFENNGTISAGATMDEKRVLKQGDTMLVGYVGTPGNWTAQ